MAGPEGGAETNICKGRQRAPLHCVEGDVDAGGFFYLSRCCMEVAIACFSSTAVATPKKETDGLETLPITFPGYLPVSVW